MSENHEDEEFRKKLKELCLKFDLENGEHYDPTYAGCEIYEFYCEENGLESNYLGELYELEDGKPGEKTAPGYYISEEEIKIGDVVCDGYTTVPVGIVTGILESGTVIDGGIGFALESGRIIIKEGLKKLGVVKKQ